MTNSNQESKSSNGKTTLTPEEVKKIESELEFIPEYLTEEDLPTGDSVRMLGYGGPGSGKTEFCVTGAEETVILNIGKGIETIQNLGAKKRNPNRKISIIDIDRILKRKDGKPPTDLEMIAALSDAVYHATRVKGFKNICIDDMTEFRHYALLKGMKINLEQGKSKSYEQYEKNDELMTPVVQDFGVEMNIVEDFLRWLCNDAYELSYNIIVTAHTRYIYKKVRDQSGKAIIGETPTLDRELPGFTGQTFPDYIPRLFSIVGMFQQAGVQNDGSSRIRLYLQGGRDRCVKHRYSGVLPEYLDNPRFDKIVAAIKSNIPLSKS